MIIIKPDWVSHGDRTQDARNKKPCIYSINVHPDGKRLATGSLDGNVKIWNIEPIIDENAERDPNCHKLLCTMTMHNGAVLCVRWSNGDGRYLASSSDNDNLIIIWELDSHAGVGTVFGSSEVNYETWRAVKYLRGHESDVQDLAWSKDNQYLASCGVDGYVIVWNTTNFEQVVKIDQHSGFVKGVTWDPAGKYLASQSDDKMVKVWRTSDWGLETDLINPFINAPGTTLFRRLSWSPDGAHVAAANAVNGIQCIAAIINRDDWNADVSLVGHQLPIEVTSFNPKMFYMKDDDDDQDRSLATICALGSQDRSISIWVTKFSRPVCVATDIFDNNVYDICWAPDGRSLFACSQDGTIACIQFDTELEDIASDEMIYKELAKYGYGRKNTQLPETATQLELEADNAIVSKASKRITELMTGNTTFSSIPTQVDTPMADVEPITPATEAIATTTSEAPSIIEQKVTIAKNGKKRIQPMSISSSTSLTSTTHRNTAVTPVHTTKSSQPVIEYDEPALPNTGVGSSLVGNKRKSTTEDEDTILLSRKRPEWIDTAVVPPVVEKSQIRMGLPKVKSILTTKINAAWTMECHNGPNLEDTITKSKVIVSQEGTQLWMDYVPSAILLMTGNEIYSAIGCEDGSIYIYSPQGQRLLPPMVMESTPVILQCNKEGWLLCLTATGLVYTWDVVAMKSQLHGVSIGPLLQSAQLSEERTSGPRIRDVRIQKNGIPIFITSLQQAFVYHLDMKVWMRISDAWYIISEFWGSDLQPAEDGNPLGWLSSRMSIHGQQDMDPTSKLIMNIAKVDEKTTSIITISHIETQLAVAALLESPQEYLNWIMYYAKKLSEANARDKVDGLCRWLMGPPFISPKLGQWEPQIMGVISKKDVLKQILPVLSENRQLQRLIAEFKSLI